MNCSKCGKEIAEGENTICDECQKKLLEEIEEETKQEDVSEEESKKEKKIKKTKKKEENSEKKIDNNEEEKKEKKKILPKIITLIIIIAIIASIYIVFGTGLISFKKVGNSIGNIRNYGYMAENGGYIFFVAPDENGEKMCIYKVRKNGTNKEIILTENWDILGLNIYKNKIYFIAINNSVETEDENDAVDNKIYAMNLDGSDLIVINDNEFNNDSYEIYAINNKIYYIGTDANIYSMNLDGENKEVINSDATGFLGITEKYILFNIQEEDEEGNQKIVTYSMDLNGENKKALTGERLYSVNIIDDEVYYVNEEKEVNKVNIVTGEKKEISTTSAYNMNISNNKIYFMNYCDEDYNIAIYKMDLDGSNEEELLKLDTYSTFLDVVGNKILYMDSNDEKGVINLLDGKSKETVNLYEFIFETEESGPVVEDTTE